MPEYSAVEIQKYLFFSSFIIKAEEKKELNFKNAKSIIN